MFPDVPLCVSRHFISPDALIEHVRGKYHKKRLKLLKEEPYTQAEVCRERYRDLWIHITEGASELNYYDLFQADAAAGLGKPDNGKRGGRSLVMDEDMMIAD